MNVIFPFSLVHSLIYCIQAVCYIIFATNAASQLYKEGHLFYEYTNVVSFYKKI